MNHVIKAAAAPAVLDWLRTRGGVLVWTSVDLCDPSKTWTTPAIDPDGKPATKPSWQAASEPDKRIESADDIEVVTPKEVRRFRVALRMGSSGTRVKLTDHSSTKLRKAVAAAGDEAWYEFDYSTQEAVIYVPSSTITLAEYASTKGI